MGMLGEVGLASGLLELVRGGGGGGMRLLLTFDNSSAFRSGTGGFPTERCGCGGLVSVSEPLGYECRRLRPMFGTVNGSVGYKLVCDSCVVTVLCNVCELSSDVESSGRCKDQVDFGLGIDFGFGFYVGKSNVFFEFINLVPLCFRLVVSQTFVIRLTKHRVRFRVGFPR